MISIVDPPLSTASAPGAGLGLASDFAGSTTSAIFPPPGAVETESALDSFFPDATEVGFAGPTPSTYSFPSSSLCLRLLYVVDVSADTDVDLRY